MLFHMAHCKYVRSKQLHTDIPTTQHSIVKSGEKSVRRLWTNTNWQSFKCKRQCLQTQSVCGIK